MIATGKRDVMLIMMISDVPLPIPRWVIWSASHMTSSEAAVMQITVMMLKPSPGWVTICTLPRPNDAGF
jgi:hypothetical protein